MKYIELRSENNPFLKKVHVNIWNIDCMFTAAQIRSLIRFVLCLGAWHRVSCITTSECPRQQAVHDSTSWPAPRHYRRHPCHALFHRDHVTETVAPFTTTAYLNMTPNYVNHSAICQFGREQENTFAHWHTSAHLGHVLWAWSLSPTSVSTILVWICRIWRAKRRARRPISEERCHGQLKR